ncbi:MAG: tetratricopeptide repeat-containing sensor histidine kinase [Bacteroidales bacterium]|nr:tetratricopeptide repeat-containing sensor histidine kinase [Bacteroidales bacterium]
MHLIKYLIPIIILGSAVTSATGQDPSFTRCLKYPHAPNLVNETAADLREIGARYSTRGDIAGLEMSISGLSDLIYYYNPLYSVDIYLQQGILRYYKNENEKSLSAYLKALDILLANDNRDGINSLYNNIAIIFARVEDHESTLKYLNRALAYTSPDDPIHLPLQLNVAITESLLGNHDKALEIAFDLYGKFDHTREDYSVGTVVGVIIECYNSKSQYDEALQWIEMIPDSLTDLSGFADLASFCEPAMETYFNKGDYKRVTELGQYLYPPPDPGFIPEIYDALEYLSKAYAQLGNYDMALQFEKLLRETEFSRTSYSREELVSLLMTDYAFNLNNIAHITAEQELRLNRERERSLKTFIYSFLLLILLFSVFIVVLIRLRRLRKSYSTLLSAENNKLAILNREINSSNHLLEKENNLLDTLISVFAHDLINPFQAILGFSRLMLTDYDSIEKEDITEYTTLLSETSFHLNQLLSNLRNMALLQGDQHMPPSTSFKITGELENVTSIFSAALHKKSLKINISGNREARGLINREIFSSVMRNVISNAVKFSFENNSIDIRIGKSGKMISVITRDYGTGMPEEYRLKLESKEYFISNPGTQHEKGSGLGLTICMELLDLYGSSMHIASSEGEGTTITIIIPSGHE